MLLLILELDSLAKQKNVALQMAFVYKLLVLLLLLLSGHMNVLLLLVYIIIFFPYLNFVFSWELVLRWWRDVTNILFEEWRIVRKQ